MAAVLLIEPDRLLADSYTRSLTAAGHDVLWSDGAQSAINTADRKRPDVVVIELQLAGHSGVEFLYEFRSYPEWDNVPVIILSQVPVADSGLTPKTRHDLHIVKYLYKPETSLKQLAKNLVASLQPVA